jgi:uncharacterized membrane protein YheB (UPF0754 family)
LTFSLPYLPMAFDLAPQAVGPMVNQMANQISQTLHLPPKLWFWILPPIAGGVIGYFTNDLAIQMLFRPYRPVIWFGRQLPFTPGLIPANQSRLAKRVSDAILGSLLTPDEIQKIAQRLLSPERLRSIILWLLEQSVAQVRAQTTPRSRQILAGILQDLFSRSLPRMLKVWARQAKLLDLHLNPILDPLLLDVQLSSAQADQLSRWLLRTFPADRLRSAIVDFLTDRNIQAIDDAFREKSSGTYWVLANLFGVKNALNQLRSYCLDQRETSNQLIEELIRVLQVQRRLQESLENLSLQNLPTTALWPLRQALGDAIRMGLRQQDPQLIARLDQSVDWEAIAQTLLNRLQSSDVLGLSLELTSEELAQILERYLERDLESIVSQTLPILNLDQVIVERIEATAPADLELAVQSIVRSELQAIVNLGGLLGFFIGILQTLAFLLQSSP